MKFLTVAILGLTLSNFAFAEQETTYTYKKVDSNTSSVLIDTHTEEINQAAIFVDGSYNKKFVEELLKDKKSELSQLKKKIELENCEQESTEENPYIDGCGEVELTAMVQTSFGRGGWASAGAAYTFFVGFRNHGTGRFFNSTHMITITENVEAVSNDGEEFKGIFINTLNLTSVKKL